MKRTAKPLPSVERIRELLAYDSETGEFFWRVANGGAAAGAKAGCNRPRGYIHIRVDRQLCYAHRIAWKMIYGRDPAEVDHVNGDPSDNRAVNLREVNRAQNQMNRRPNDRDLPKGVAFRPGTGRYDAKIKLAGKDHYLGRFDTAEAAAAAYAKAADRMFGEYARHGVTA